MSDRPSLAEIRNWQHDRITVFLLKNLIHKFPHYDSLIPIKSQDQLAEVNFRAGSYRVLEAIEKFCTDGEV